MPPELTKQLEQFLRTAEIRRAEFKGMMSDEEKKDNAIDFQSKIINILDYAYTNFPVPRKDLADHYPRPDPKETENDYFTRIQKHKIIPEGIRLFLSHCFQVNNKFNEAISYIISKVKHEKPNEFGKNLAAKLEAKFTSTYPDPIKKNPDGSIEIAGIFKIAPGGSAKIANSVFKGPDGILSIDSLDFSGAKFEGDIIVLKNGEKKVYTDWTADCIAICKEIIDYLK